MLAGLMRVGEMTGGFHYDLCADRTPIQLAGISDCENLDRLAADIDGVRFDFDVLLESAENGIVFQQVGQGLRIGQIIDRHEFDILSMQTRSDYIPADAAKAVNSNFYRHCEGTILLFD